MMMFIRIMCIISVTLALSSCSSMRSSTSPAERARTIRVLEARLVGNPYDAESLRNLGALLVQDGQHAKAEEVLRRAIQLSPGNGKSLFYLGLALEYQGRNTEALEVYGKYSAVDAMKEFAPLMEGRFYSLTREVTRAELRTRLANEQNLTTKEAAPNTVAVFPFQYRGTDERFAPLGLGLSEMLTIDLAKVQKLTVVERIRTEELLKELAFGASDAVDPATAPRVGKILAASRVVGGSYTVADGSALRIDASSVQIARAGSPASVTQSDNIERLFDIEKDVVFKLVDEFGIRISQVERDAILRIPTKNIQSFLAYCLGLEKERAGDFRGAAASYQEAAAMDPGFTGAADKAKEAESQGVAGTSKEQTLTVAARMGAASSQLAGQRDLMWSRAQMLQDQIQSGFIPGEESRQSAGDAFLNGAGLGSLPAPPPPPP